jgi:predicted phosphodiesterase
VDRPQSPRRLATLTPIGVAILVGVVGAWGGMLLWGHTVTTLGPFRVELASSYGPGETDIELPPFGRLTADTHLAPLRLRATLRDVQVTRLTSTLSDGGLDRLAGEVERDAGTRLRSLALRVLLAGAAGALLLGLIAFRRDARRVAVAVVAALVAVGGSQALALATYRPDAFLDPTYSGSLALAPEVIGPVAAATKRIDAFRAQLTRVVDGAVRAYTSVQASPLGNANEIRVLHISDIHISPVGFEFARQIADGFDVDFVLDTGDITSFGTPVENLILQNIPAFDRPYVFVRGSHDSTGLQAEVAKIQNATVLDGNTATVDGISMYGLGHPVFVSDRSQPIDGAEFEATAEAACARVKSDVEALPLLPEMIAVHDDRMTSCMAGLVPLVVSGHFHENTARTENGTLFLRVGTTGGAGPTLFTDEGVVVLSAEVLYFRPGTPPQLVAYDVITQNPETGNLTVTRELVTAEPLAPPTPSPTFTPSSSST